MKPIVLCSQVERAVQKDAEGEPIDGQVHRIPKNSKMPVKNIPTYLLIVSRV